MELKEKEKKNLGGRLIVLKVSRDPIFSWKSWPKGLLGQTCRQNYYIPVMWCSICTEKKKGLFGPAAIFQKYPIFESVSLYFPRQNYAHYQPRTEAPPKVQ